jgi:hypothetical protein
LSGQDVSSSAAAMTDIAPAPTEPNREAHNG